MSRSMERSWLGSVLGLGVMLSLSVMPLPDAVRGLRPDWVAVLLIYWSLAAPRRFSLISAFAMGLVLDTLHGALLGQHALALLVVVYAAERFYLRVRLFPVSQLAITVLILLALYQFILFWIDGIAGRTVPLVERWAPPLTGTLVWVAMSMVFGRRVREAHARI
mgnify:CR=1 FL=1